ncbi:MAG: cytochrome c553, partial [Saprospiraceae bacterium]
MHKINYLLLLVLASLCYVHCAVSDQAGVTASVSTPTKDAKANYTEYCASCHGSDARAFADRKNWVHGSDKASLIGVIAKGLVDEGMPSFDARFSAEETAALADYIIEAKEQVEKFAFDNEFDQDETFNYNGHSYKLELVTDQVDIPWGMVQATNGDLFFGDKAGALSQRKRDGSIQTITGLPEIRTEGQGGLMDISLDPGFDDNRHIYLSYSKQNPENDS